MSNPRTRVDLIDADGCVYNSHYNYLLFSVLDKYSSLLSLTPADKVTKEQTSEILGFIKSVDLNDADIANVRKKHYQCIENLRQVVSIHKSKIQKYMLAMDVSFDGSIDVSASFSEEDKKYFFHYVQHCIEKLNEIDPKILNHIFLAANAGLVKELMANPEDFDKQVIMIGSARQDFKHDEAGIKLRLTNSIYRDLNFLTEYLRENYAGAKQVELNPVTLADVYGELQSGESFKKILASVHRSLHKSAVYDKTKLTILYLAVHANPDAVQLNFYDDNWQIRQAVSEVFRKHPVLIPNGMHLRVVGYDGQIDLHHSVNGTGKIDTEFQNTIRQMYNLSLMNQARPDVSYIDAANAIDVRAFVESHTAGSDDANLAILLDADGCFYNYLYDVMIMEVINKHHDSIRLAATKKMSSANVTQLTQDMHAFIQNYAIDKIKPSDVKRLKNFLDLRGVDKKSAISCLHGLCPDLIDEALYKANHHLFEGLAERARELQCKRITLMVGSNRQSHSIDDLNSSLHGTRSFYLDLSRMTELLNRKIGGGVRFHLDKFLLADVYANVPAGTSFMRSLSSDSHYIRHADTVWEEKKSHTIYGFLHYIARRYPNTMAVEFIDDRIDIHDAIVAAYGNEDKHAVLPAHMPLRLVLYSGDAIVRHNNYEINGSGVVDVELHKSLRMIAKGFGVESVSRAARENRCITATEIEGFYGKFAAARAKYNIKIQERKQPVIALQSDSDDDDDMLDSLLLNRLGFFASDASDATVTPSQSNSGWKGYVPEAVKRWF